MLMLMLMKRMWQRCLPVCDECVWNGQSVLKVGGEREFDVMVVKVKWQIYKTCRELTCHFKLRTAALVVVGTHIVTCCET